jgi:predicted DNA-binding protein with PD1-like motif
MKYARISGAPATSYAVVFDPGDEVVEGVTAFAKREHILAARLTGIGGLSQARLGYFDREKRRYEPIDVDEQVELLALTGDLAMKEDAPLLHAHALVGHRGGAVTGGHLISGRVWPTLELFVDAYPTRLEKIERPDIGIATISLE